MMQGPTKEAPVSQRLKHRPAFGFVAAVGLLAATVAAARAERIDAASRTEALAHSLGERGLVVDPEGVVWLQAPPFRTLATVNAVPVVVRARPGEEEPHDIFLVFARLSPEGVLLDVRGAYNLTETSSVDELAPIGSGSAFAFAEQISEDEAPSTVRLFDLAGKPDATGWSRLERVQAALSQLQKTGRVDGVRRMTYRIRPAPQKLELSLADGNLSITTDEATARIALDTPLAAPDWLAVESFAEPRPPELVPWAVDRVRAEIGDDAMQYVKAIAFSMLDVALASKEEMTGDTGAEEIAADLGQDDLAAPTRVIPVDPDIGFPPPPLEPWVTPALQNEGAWQPKDEDPFIHTLPGLPPTFVTTFIRSDQRRKATRVYIVLWDPRLVELRMMPGTSEPKSATGDTGPGLIPREPKVLRRVAAAMNAGFQALHGEFGMMGDGVVYLPPKPYGATVAVTSDGSTAFGTWPLDPTIPYEVQSFRQNMTPIVQDGEFNVYGRNWWGGTPPGWEDTTHTVRTGICMTKEGFVGYFYGADLSPEALGRAMLQTRCSYGVALDMNAGHSGLEFYKVAPEAEFEPLGRPLNFALERTGNVADMDGWTFRARRLISGMGLMYFPRYIEREARDFFYLTLRDVLPGRPLAKDAKENGWRVKGLPQHGFPYALASGETALPSGARARVLKIDPRMLTTSEKEAVRDKGRPGIVASFDAVEGGDTGVWFSPDAFALGSEGLVEGAVRIAAGSQRAPSGGAAAAVGVEEEGGMLVYVELDKNAPAAELEALLGQLGVTEIVWLDRKLALALGGDTDLASQPVQLPAGATTLLRKPGAGVRRIFESTPIVEMKVWHPLQARRIRYFKKKKKDT
jgi:hypothetical protein